MSTSLLQRSEGDILYVNQKRRVAQPVWSLFVESSATIVKVDSRSKFDRCSDCVCLDPHISHRYHTCQTGRPSGGAPGTGESGGSGSGRGDPLRCALKLSPESAARAEQRRGRRSGSSSPMESPTDGGTP